MRTWRSWIGSKSLEFQTVLGGAIFIVAMFTISMVIGDSGWLSTLILSIVTATLLEVPLYIYTKRKVQRTRE